MIKKISIILLIGILLALGGLALPAAADDGGTFTGQLINGTPGGGGVGDQAVTLVTYLNDQPVSTNTTTRTDADGRFTFTGLNTATGYGYDAYATYRGVSYWGALSDNGTLPSFKPGENTMSNQIYVYDTTTDESSVITMLSHMIISAQDNSVQVLEYYVFATSDNRTFIGKSGDPGVLHFSLPAGTSSLQVGYGPTQSQVVTDAGGFWDTRPVPPEGSEVGYSYSLALQSGQVDLTRPIDYATASLDVVVPQGTLNISGGQLTTQSPMTVSGASYDHYSASNLAPGQNLTMVISKAGSGGSSTNGNSSSNVLPIVIGVGVAVILAFIAFMFWRRRPVAAPVDAGGATRQEQLLAELAGLDDQFDKGEIDEATYRKLRDKKKTELMQLMRTHRRE